MAQEKTSSAITNILDELIRKNIYGLIIDVKGNYINSVEKVAKKYNKQDLIYKVSLDSNVCYNPLDKEDISTLELANRMKKVLQILSEKSISDSFWLDKAEMYIRDFITIIKVYKEYVSFSELHKIITSYEYLNEKIEEVKRIVLANKLDDETLFNVNSAIYNIKNEYLKLDDRTINIIRAEITRITNLFVSDYTIFRQFCSKNNLKDFYHKITVLSINYGENKYLAKVISTYLKLDFQSQVLSQKNNFIPIFFICDEFQEYANVEDSNFFSLSREYKCINVVSMQSYSSLLHTIKDKDAVNVILQNLVNKIWFRNDDNYTISEIIKQLGKEEKETDAVSYSESNQNVRYSLFSNKFKNYNSGLSKTYSLNKRIDYKYTEDYFSMGLCNFECACLLSDGNAMTFYEKIFLKRWEG
ncbi:MAG: type IV secretion system DNA-binding domain-containing protein [Clostridia bacterium]|nr:type IV secretion system DNA-binding domain-containing protein [Clostridia bacterium]